MKHRRLEQGFALISAIWLVILLTVLGIGLSYSGHQSTRALAATLGATKARYLAEGGVQLVMSNLLVLLPSERLLGDGETMALDFGDGSADVSVYDENGKVDINYANEDLLSRLFHSLGAEQTEAEALAGAIADYRDQDDLVRLHGAEDADYQGAGLSWGPKNNFFTSIQELRKVYGMRADLLQTVLPYVTVYSKNNGINPEVAPLQVLLAIYDGSELTLESYVEQRRQNHLNGLSPPVPPVFPKQYVNHVKGVTYLIQSLGKTSSGYQAGIATTVKLRRSGGRYFIETLDWTPHVEAPAIEEVESVREMAGGP